MSKHDIKIILVLGTRPEAIKLAPVIRELKRQSGVQTVVCVSAQHRQLLNQVLSLFKIVPDYDLNIMEERQTPTQVASAVLSRLEPLLQKEKPDWMLVQGDTTTTAAASLAAFYTRIKIGHVEAGLRTYKKWQPFPEEINRRIVGILADLHFAPTEQARKNLLSEGVPNKHILVTGNPVIDALFEIKDFPPPSHIRNLLMKIGVESRSQERLILVTSHRRENFGRPLENLCAVLRDLTSHYNGKIHIVYSVHPNPNVWEPVHQLLGAVKHLTLAPPLDYLSLVHLMKQSYLILTDSGGIQEEAPSLGKPVLVLRKVTERPEAVEAGTVKLVGTDRKRILAETMRLLDDPSEYKRMAQAINPYGDGQASRRIVASLLGYPVEPFVATTSYLNVKQD